MTAGPARTIRTPGRGHGPPLPDRRSPKRRRSVFRKTQKRRLKPRTVNLGFQAALLQLSRMTREPAFWGRGVGTKTAARSNLVIRLLVRELFAEWIWTDWKRRFLSHDLSVGGLEASIRVFSSLCLHNSLTQCNQIEDKIIATRVLYRQGTSFRRFTDWCN